MNSPASLKRARRTLISLAAIAGAIFTVGCGSNGSRIPPLGGSFSRASLKGQYILTQTGAGINVVTASSVDPFSETTIFTADAAGNLNVTVDDFNQGGQFLAPTTLPETGTYSITSDGTGSLNFGGASFAITMIDDSHFYVMEQDAFATSSGYGELQDTTAFVGPPSGTFVFKAHRLSGSSRVGDMTIGCRSDFRDRRSVGYRHDLDECSDLKFARHDYSQFERRGNIYFERLDIVQLLRRQCQQVRFHVEQWFA
jgi:hypothetical protein